MNSTAYFSGLLTSLGLIVAIGAQNAFVLRQGLKKEFVLPVVAFCALSDIILIFAGVAGVGAAVEKYPVILTAAKYGGAAFLFAYGIFALQRARKGGAAMPDGGQTAPSLFKALATCAAFTYLNPHVYLDTMLLLGTLSTAYAPPANWVYGAGAGTSSILWFSALGFGARFLIPLFRKARAWQILDFCIGIMMIALAAMLLFEA